MAGQEDISKQDPIAIAKQAERDLNCEFSQSTMFFNHRLTILEPTRRKPVTTGWIDLEDTAKGLLTPVRPALNLAVSILYFV